MSPTSSKIINFKSEKGYILILTPYKSSDNVFEDTLLEANNLIKNLEENTEETHFFDWTYGLPTASSELFINQKKIANHEIKNLHICGDFMGIPSLDACVESSKFVADEIIK